MPDTLDDLAREAGRARSRPQLPTQRQTMMDLFWWGFVVGTGVWVAWQVWSAAEWLVVAIFTWKPRG